MENNQVEKIELWQPTDGDDAEAIREDGTKLKRVAVIVNGFPIMLEKDFFLERRIITKEEADKLLAKS